jgi:hypothetical protein
MSEELKAGSTPLWAHNSALTSQMSRWLMSHFWPGSIGARSDELKANGRPTVRTFRSDSLFVKDVIVVFFEPHQLKTFRAAAHLRSHGLPLTLQLID